MFLRKVLRNLLRSLQWRLVFIFIAMTLFLVIPISLLLKNDVETSYYDAFKNSIEDGANSKAWAISNKPTMEELKKDLDKLGEKRNSIYLFNINSKDKSYSIINSKKLSGVTNLGSNSDVIESTDPEYSDNQSKLSFVSEVLESENFISAIANGRGYKKKIYTIASEPKRSYFDYAFMRGDFVIYFRYYSDDWSRTIDKLNNTIINSAIIAILVSLTFGYILSKTITGPIVTIMHKAQGIAKGNFDQEVLHVKSDDEIGKLTKSFNFMAHELKDTLNEISSEKNKVETILNYMTDGIIAYNLKGEVIHTNPASKWILGTVEIDGTFNAFSEKYHLGIMLEDVLYLDSQGSKEIEITIQDKYIKVYFALFTDEEKKAEGIIVVLHDVTEQQKLENMRREFVANVSHELRTPLTSIKSYSETLLDGALEDRETSERFLGVINSEADRMTRIVKDLLQLSRLDNQQMQWSMQPVNFMALVKKSVDHLQIEAKNKNQQLESFVIGDIPEISGDKDRIEQVSVNILSNAIKYTPEGGSITVYIGKLYNEVYMKVVDTGIGIPEKDMPRLFERFYRVDKARSREMGGTGLGLSIAKEIVEAHGGDITIHSEVDKGTEVIVKLPIERIQ